MHNITVRNEVILKYFCPSYHLEDHSDGKDKGNYLNINKTAWVILPKKFTLRDTNTTETDKAGL